MALLTFGGRGSEGVVEGKAHQHQARPKKERVLLRVAASVPLALALSLPLSLKPASSISRQILAATQQPHHHLCMSLMESFVWPE